MPVAVPVTPSTASAVSNLPSAASSRRVWILAILCVLPLLLVYGILWREATGLPVLDDYHAIFVFALGQRHLPAMGRLVNVVAAQHNEYKLIFEHAIVAADLAFTGHIHLSFLIWLGNLLLVPLGIIFWAQFRPNDTAQRRLLLFLPLSWLLFQLTYAEMVDWAMEALQALAVVCFAVASFYLLTRQSRRSFLLACATGGLAALSSANGFVVAVIGAGLLFRQRRLARIVPWCLTFAAALAAYLYRYTPVPHGAPASLSVRLLFVPSMIGGVVENMHGFPIHHAAIVLGVILLAVYAHALRHGYYRTHPFLVATASWALITVLMTAWVRSSMGLNLSLSSRYKIYSTLMLVFCYQYLADRIVAAGTLSTRTKKTLYGGALAAAVIFALLSDAMGVKLLKTRKAEAIAALGWYLAAPQTHSPFPEHLDARAGENDATGLGIEARQSLSESLASGIYTLPAKATEAACELRSCVAIPASGN